MQAEFTVNDGAVNIRDVETPIQRGQLNTTIAVNSCYTVLSTNPDGDTSKDTLIINLNDGQNIGVFKASDITVPSGHTDFSTLRPAIDGLLFEPPVDENPWVVNVLSNDDLPPDVAGAVQLLDYVTYVFPPNYDLNGLWLIGGLNTFLRGQTSEVSHLSSTGKPSGQAMIQSDNTITIRDISFIGDNILALDGDANISAIDWQGVNFVNCTNIGFVKNYSNAIIERSALLNSSGLSYDGTFGTIGFNGCFFDSDEDGTAITVEPTAEITRRFRILNSSFVVLDGEVGINFSDLATIDNEQYILDNVNFGGSSTTMITGVLTDSNKAHFKECTGITNTTVDGYLYMLDNSTPTPIATQGTFYKILGATTEGDITAKFEATDNRLTCKAAIERTFRVECKIDFESGNNNQVEFRFYDSRTGTTVEPSKRTATAGNAGRAEGVSLFTIMRMKDLDYTEVHCTNHSSTTAITVTNIQLLVTEG